MIKNHLMCYVLHNFGMFLEECMPYQALLYVTCDNIHKPFQLTSWDVMVTAYVLNHSVPSIIDKG